MTDPKGCVPTGHSDHAPLVGSVKGGPRLDWRLGTAAGHTGTATTGVGWTNDHGGTAVLNGTTGQITASGPAVDTTRGFTVSAWAKVDTTAGTSVVLAQDGVTISGMMLWCNQPDSTWRFALPKGDSDTWSVDQVKTPAVTNTWTHLTGTFDAATNTVALYVNGVPAGTASHTDIWSATGPFVVGRDEVKGLQNGFFKGSLQAVKAYDYAMTAAQAASAAGSLTPPTGTVTRPTTTDETGPGCHAKANTPGEFGTVDTSTPELTAYVAHPDPSREVWAEFSIWDSADKTLPQPIVMGDENSPSAKVLGSGTVSVRVPVALQRGRQYGWWVRTTDGPSSRSTTSAVCHFIVSPTAP
ncbi:LamG domain-containing protein [Streptomyces sp. NBC_01244]|uniref:LamG domain-containing protein n=1 Tax=Streptomyces sp. NBC_01244 TaxID=2903797 RepID=UPI002E11EA5C|nr:LamG domain-containing protein [Streptomyces sp. NBC_01244]